MMIIGGSNPAEMMVGMAVGGVIGKQMANTMNNVMQDMQQNSAQQPPPQAPGQAVMPPVPGQTTPPGILQFNVTVNGQSEGPFDMNTLAEMARNGQLTTQSPVWRQGMPGWAAAGTVRELAEFFPVQKAMPQSQFHKEGIMYDERNFYSTDRLIKFGMSTSVAQQMVNTMNHAIQNMQIPGAGNPMRPAQTLTLADIVYYAMIDGQQTGPFCETELVRLINDKKLSKETYVWHTGLAEWKTAENIPAILRLVAIAPPPPPDIMT
ncbi:MAG: DUF4339 domain-containing protein [Treponema sp.]|jgi:hypothetical protein|nr:DUF4339 domain-containing protein [Treponema sp.]